jgi:hypothetical protein
MLCRREGRIEQRPVRRFYFRRLQHSELT